jgi:trehalose/maltose transport system substrate-binding protein
MLVCFSPLLAACGAEEEEAGAVAAIKVPAPAVPGAAQAKQYGGQTITYYGDSVGLGAEMDKTLARRFTQDTGIRVNVVPKPTSATENYSTYQRFFQGQSSAVDVMMIDVIWPGAFARHLVDLRPKLGEAVKEHDPAIVENNTIDNKLVAMPWFVDFGMLYYRSDLLRKYGFSAPPKTWDELEQQTRTVMQGERRTNPSFQGFVFQGNAYEGLTCNALEWLASAGGGVVVTEDKKVTVDNPEAAAMLTRAQGWVGSVAPRGVTSYQEEDARNVFQGGNAMFMRNWPYAYASGNGEDSPIKGKFEVAPLPVVPGQKPVGTAGGWQLGVSRYSDNQDASIEFVRYMTSPEAQTWRAIVGSYVPTIERLQESPQVVKALPFLRPMRDVEIVARPSAPLGIAYNEGSTAFFQGVNLILNGREPSATLPQVEQRIDRALSSLQ